MPDLVAAVAEPNRRRLLQLLGRGEQTVNELASHFTVSRPAISQHLAILLRTRLVRARRVGRERHYGLQPEPLEAIHDWVGSYERFWKSKLGALGEHLRKHS